MLRPPLGFDGCFSGRHVGGGAGAVAVHQKAVEAVQTWKDDCSGTIVGALKVVGLSTQDNNSECCTWRRYNLNLEK